MKRCGFEMRIDRPLFLLAGRARAEEGRRRRPGAREAAGVAVVPR
jgi:hypothetical protein